MTRPSALATSVVVVRATAVVAALATVALLSLATPDHASAQEAPGAPVSVQAESAASIFPGGLFVQPKSIPEKEGALLASAGDSTDAAAADFIAKRPIAIWLTSDLTGSKLASYLTTNLDEAAAAGKTAVFVTYAIPDRDCGGYSAGGLTDSTYLPWNKTIATTLAGHHAVVLVEPDSIGETTTCPGIASTRFPLLKAAVAQFAENHVPAYLDGGNSRWLKPSVMASLLEQAGVSDARGFFTNVANYISVTNETSYADQLSALTGGSHFVIDVSRDGQGYKGTWCNAVGAGLGQDPYVAAGTTKLDALLWVKTPGVSDGTCNGGPPAGDWFAEYADALVKLRA